jgi:Tfp pilus assembly protein PilF
LKAEGLRLTRSAAELEDQTEKHPVTPGAVIPARELYADMLLENGQPADALAEAEKVLTVAPNRYNAILLAARSAESTGDTQKAQAHYRELLQLAKGNSSRPELERARTYMAAK